MDNKTLFLLLVEDNPGDADLTSERLSDLPGFCFELKRASRLADAMAILDEDHIDAVVLDLNLPDSSGLETLRQLRLRQNDLAIVVLSGDDREELRRHALREGAQDFIAKNEPTARLVARSVLYACERQRAIKGIQQVQRLVSNNPDAVIVTAVDGVIQFVNRAARELFGKTGDDLIGERLELTTEGEVTEIEVSRGKETRSVQMRVASFEWDERPAFLVVMRDVTEREKMAAQLRQAQKMEAVGRLAGGIAHDFNNLLTAILGYGSILRDRLSGEPELLPFAGHLLQAAEKATTLTAQLLAFSRKQVLNPRVLDLNTVLSGLEDLLHRVIGEDVHLNISLSPIPCKTYADPSQIEQVILNLAINARDAMPKGGRLSFEVSTVELDRSYVSSHAAVAPGPYVMLTVSDTGVGMDKETLSQIFEPFFTTKELGKGTGLGLSTVYGIVKQSGGHIWVYSEPGLGASFKIYLPESAEKPSEDVETAPVASAVGGAETILLVEDEAAVRDFIRLTLEMAGYKVLAAGEGEEALSLALQQTDPIHLVVTDVVMPGIPGPKLAKRLAKTHPESRILFLSGYALETGIHNGVLSPGVAFLEKPFSGEVLRRKIREILDADD